MRAVRGWRPLWKLCFAAGVSFATLVSVAQAQQPAPAPNPDPNQLLQRLERLEQQNQELQRALLQKQAQPVAIDAVPTGQPAAVDPKAVEKIVGDYLKVQDDKKKAAADAKAADDKLKGFEVGSDLKMSANWNAGVVIETAKKDFSLHVGGWVQYDNVFWGQSNGLTAAPGPRPGAKQGVATGAPTGGIGDLEDGSFFRRERIMLDGNLWENYEYTFVFAFENDQFNISGLDEFWVGAKNVPFLGTVRLGHVKNAIGLEADMTGSSRTMTFMERSSYSEAIELNQNFVTGLWLGNNYLDQRTTWSGVIFRPDPGASTGAFFGDGQWGWQGRITALPIYQDEGRHLMHVGLSGGWRDGSNTLAVSSLNTTQLRARPELRDDVPPGGFANGDSNRMIDTNAIVCKNDWLCGLEFLYICGPLSVQAEYGWNFADDATGFSPAGLKLNPALAAPQNYTFSGGYIQLAYTLTGENRAYDKRLGRLDSYYFGRKGPYENAFAVRGDDSHIQWGWGAWELAGRYSYTNLNDGSGLNRVQGGVMDGLTLGLNWYLNTNIKFQFDWVYDRRTDMAPGTIEGYTSGYGMRMQFMY